MSGASERANGGASGPVLSSEFLVDLAHSATIERGFLEIMVGRAGDGTIVLSMVCLFDLPLYPLCLSDKFIHLVGGNFWKFS